MDTNQLIRSFNVIRIESTGLTMSKISFCTLLNGGISVNGLVDSICTIPLIKEIYFKFDSTKLNKQNILDKRNLNHPDVSDLFYQYPLFEINIEVLVVNFDCQGQERNLNMIYNPFLRHRLNILEKHV